MKYFSSVKRSAIPAFMLGLLLVSMLGAAEVRWLSVGDLHNWYSSAGSEKETGRTGQVSDQLDGFRYPALYPTQDLQAAKGIWIGAKDYSDPLDGKTYNFKVLAGGPRHIDENSGWMTQEFKLVARKAHPTVIVDNVTAGKLDLVDDIDEIDPTLQADRMIYNVVNTSMGVQMIRKVMAFTHPDHQNYYIYEFEFTHNGVYDQAGSSHSNTLQDVYFHWQFRYGFNREGTTYELGILPQNATWGRNAVNHAVGQNGNWGPGATDPFLSGHLGHTVEVPFRATLSWGGTHSQATTGTAIGAPYFQGDGHLTSQMHAGLVTLHADASASDETDDPLQPANTNYLASDDPTTHVDNQFDAGLMTSMYKNMTMAYPAYSSAGHPVMSHAEEVYSSGTEADQWGASLPGSAGGFSQTVAYGPYTMAPGDNVRIVYAEAAAGLSREQAFEIGAAWLSGDLSHSEKDALVYSGADSLMKTFGNAVANYESGYGVAFPPDPPETFVISSGGDRISLAWDRNAETGAFAGYRVYRALQEVDSTYYMIADIALADVRADDDGMAIFEDRTPNRGFDYYYYVTSYDDGSVDPNGKVLESSKFFTLPSEPAYLKRQPGNALEDIRVVPNPYNIRARKRQFGESAGDSDRIMFYNLPPKCTIRIYTERGDLIKTLEHTDNSGDHAWNSITSSRQVVVSGVYLAHITVTESLGEFKEGDTVIKKIVIIR